LAGWLIGDSDRSGLLDHAAAELAHDQVRAGQVVAAGVGNGIGVRSGIVGEVRTCGLVSACRPRCRLATAPWLA
jgi:hypothetical protein